MKGLATLAVVGCASPTGPSETQLTGSALYFGPAPIDVPLIGPEVQVSFGEFRFRHSLVYGHSGYAVSAWLARRGVDTLALEVRAREQDSPHVNWVWRTDYEFQTGPLPSGIYHVRWSEIFFDLRVRSIEPPRLDTVRREMPVLDTVITIPPS